MASSQSRIADLAAMVAIHTQRIDDYLSKKSLPYPSFNTDAPVGLSLSPELEESRIIVLKATQELNDLLQGPKDLVFNHRVSVFTPIYVNFIWRFDIAHKVPVDGEITFKSLAATVGINQSALTCILRLAIAHRIFQEPSPGVIAHSAASRCIAEEAHMQSFLGVIIEEGWPGASRVVDALVKWPEASEPDQTGFALGNETEASFYTILAQDASRARRFGEYLSFHASTDGFSLRHLTDGWSWAALPSPATVVDLGGSHGDAAFALAQKYANLHIIVQDLPEIVADSKTRDGVKVEFMVHDFFTEQPVKDADVYFFRWIMHNWTDKYAIEILRALVPALKKGARVLVMDFVMPEPGVLPNDVERQLRLMDVMMLEIANARERRLEEWEGLFEEADSRFVFKGVTKPDESELSLIEVAWEG